MSTLPFREVWALDTEYKAPAGGLQEPVCLVAQELRSGREVRLWRDQFGRQPPFDTSRDVLFLAFFASAEWRSFSALGWPMPTSVIDLFAEFRMARNDGVRRPRGAYSLLAALEYYRIPSITSEEKDAGRDLVLNGPPWPTNVRREILTYCASDVDCLWPLAGYLLPPVLARRHGLEHALIRGRYTAAVARMEDAGVPIDTATLAAFRRHWRQLKLAFIEQEDIGLYDGTTFKQDRFLAWLRHEGIRWPTTPTGRPSLSKDTFKDMSKAYPQVAPIRELRHTVSDLRLEQLQVGPDGRNRAMLSPFRTATGRNGPSSNRFIFGASVWVRSLIKPPAGRALAYIDWSAQEIVVAAALSGDLALLEAVRSGDPYMDFAIRAGLAPPGATRESHKAVRDQCKAVVLGVNYGMGPQTLAYRIGGNPRHAEELMAAHQRAYPVFWSWLDRVIDAAMLTRRTSTVLGWGRTVRADDRATVLQNWPMQAHGSEMMRIAASRATEAGIKIPAPIHDALMIEADEEDLGDVVRAARAEMDRASSEVLGGVVVPTDVQVITWPDRFHDPRGESMWSRAMTALASIDPSYLHDVEHVEDLGDLSNVEDVEDPEDLVVG